MKTLKKLTSILLVAAVVFSMASFVASAEETLPCYLFEDFEAKDFANKSLDTSVPYHENGSSETLDLYNPGQSYGIEFSIEEDCDEAGKNNHYLLYHSPGGTGWRSTGMRLSSDHIKNSAEPIYEYSISYDLKVDDWAHLNADGSVKNHSSRLFSIWHGSETGLASVRLEGGCLRIVRGMGGDEGLEIDGSLNDGTHNYAQIWDTTNGIGDKHNLRFEYFVGENGEGMVDAYVDGVCVADDAIYADGAIALPSDGIYFGAAAYNSSGGQHRCKIRFDNIHLAYEGAPTSECEKGSERALNVSGNCILAKETRQSDTTYLMEHTYNYKALNNDVEDKSLFAIVAGYSPEGVMTSCTVEKHVVPAGEAISESVAMNCYLNPSAVEEYQVLGYVYDENLIPQCAPTTFEKTELDLALMALEALYDSNTMLDWLASLYDTETGGMYYATSSKQNPHLFGPHIESTYGGMYIAIPYLNADAKAALGAWIQSCQDPGSGYFVEPEFSINSVNQSKKGRDLGYAKGLLSACGMRPLYPTADQRQVAAVADDNAPELMASNGTLAGSLESWADWKAYLDSRNWSDGSVWGTCHELESNAGLIVNAGYKKQTAEYIAAKVNPRTGMLGEGLSYNTMSGTLKALWAFGSGSIPYPHVDKLFENVLDLAKNQAPGDMAQLINLPVGMQGAKNTYAAAGKPLPASVNQTLEEITPDLIRVLTKELAKFKKPDGCFGYSKTGGQAYSQGAHVSLGLNESDINGNNALAIRVRSVFYEFAGRTCSDMIPAKKLAEKLNAKWYEAHPQN